MPAVMKASDLFVRCLEAEGVERIFGVPGEENADLMISLQDSPIEFILCRHEQAAAFMADAYGRLTGKPGVCLATLGPGATNLVTGIADANMDRAPLVAIIGQAAQGKPSEHGRDCHVRADQQMEPLDRQCRNHTGDHPQSLQAGAGGKARRHHHRVARGHRQGTSGAQAHAGDHHAPARR